MSRFEVVEDVFHRALEIETSRRDQFLDQACGDEPELHQEVKSLLDCAGGARSRIGGVIEAQAGTLAAEARTRWIGTQLGPYRLTSILGEGGMGAVYVGERVDDQFSRKVAVKILPRDIGSPQAVARFRDERQILAVLSHPNIVRLLDGGSTPDDLPYLIMERIDGVPIDDFARANSLTIRDRVELIKKVCVAIHFAHQNLIVHRDIKPSNILVERDGTPKLLDFGIAKLLDFGALAQRHARTITGASLFTPDYASPEQVRGDAISTATDVYSVGAVLYELVTGRPPLRATGGVMEQLRMICEVDPVPPSQAAPPERRRELAGDVDNIVLKALQKDAARRYGSIEQLAEDLTRYLDGLPVRARVNTVGYRVRKFVGRNKARVVAASLVCATLVAATGFSVRQASLADSEARRADEAARRAEDEKVKAQQEERRARREADDARQARLQMQAQYQQLKEEEAARRRAEEEAQAKAAELRRADAMRLHQARIAETAEKQSREAEARARQAEIAERTTRVQSGPLYQREKASEERRTTQEREIGVTLP